MELDVERCSCGGSGNGDGSELAMNGGGRVGDVGGWVECGSRNDDYSKNGNYPAIGSEEVGQLGEVITKNFCPQRLLVSGCLPLRMGTSVLADRTGVDWSIYLYDPM